MDSVKVVQPAPREYILSVEENKTEGLKMALFMIDILRFGGEFEPKDFAERYHALKMCILYGA